MPITFRLENLLEKRLDALAKHTGRTRTYYLRELVAKGIDDLEDYYKNQHVRKSEQVIPTPQVRRRKA